MLSIERGEYYGLNEVGSRIWELIEEPVSVSSVCGSILEEFDVDRPKCEKTVLEYLNQLQDLGLLKQIEPI